MFSMNQIGRKLVELRKEHNMTQTELADRLGISFQAVSNWERGNSMPDISKLPELGEIFHISVDELIGGQSKLLQSAMKGEIEEYLEKNELREEEAREAVPILKPSQIEAIAEKAALLHFEDISFLLPFMARDDVREFALRAEADGKPINNFLPFMARDDIREFASRAQEDGKNISYFLPFMMEDDIRELACKAMGEGKPINIFLPFMGQLDIKKIALACMEQKDEK